MAAERQSVTYRLASTGSRDVVDTLAQIAASGEGSARRIGQAYDKDLRAAEAAVERLQRRSSKLLEVGASDVQQRVNYLTGISRGGNYSAEASMQTFVAEQDRLEQARARLLAQTDPLIAAQQRYDQTLAEANRLQAAGVLSTDQYASVQQRARAELDRTAASQGVAVQGNRAFTAGLQQMGFQASDFAVQITGGTSAVRAFAMQAPQAVQALALMGQVADGGTSRFAKFTAFLAGPWGAAATVAISVAGLLATELLETGDAAKDAEAKTYDFSEGLDFTTMSAKQTSNAMQQLAQDMRAVADAQTNYLRNTAAVASQGVAFIEDQLGKAETRAQSLRRQDPVGSMLGFGAFSAVDAEVKTLREALAKARDAETNAQIAVSREIIDERRDPMTAARGQFERALGELNRRRRVSERDVVGATSQGIFITDAQYRAEYNRISSVREAAEEAYRESQQQERRAGGAARAAEREAQRAAEQAARERERWLEGNERSARQLIDAYNPLQRVENERADKLAEINRLEKAGLQNEGLAGVEAARLREQVQAQFEIDRVAALRAMKDPATLQADAMMEAEKRRKEFIDRITADQADENVLLGQQVLLVRATEAERAKQMSRTALIIDLQREGVDLASEEAQRILTANDALSDQANILGELERRWDEQRRIGEQFIDTVLDPQNWSDFGDLGRRVLLDLANDMLRLAAINPIKNALFGTDYATMGGGGLLGFVKGIFGGATGGGPADLLAGTPFGNAAGTSHSAGGWRMVGEFGKELVRLPRGAQVMNAGRTRSMEGQAPMFAPAQISISADGADPAQLRRLIAEVQQLNAGLEQRAVQAAVDANQRTHGQLFGMR